MRNLIALSRSSSPPSELFETPGCCPCSTLPVKIRRQPLLRHERSAFRIRQYCANNLGVSQATSGALSPCKTLRHVQFQHFREHLYSLMMQSPLRASAAAWLEEAWIWYWHFEHVSDEYEGIHTMATTTSRPTPANDSSPGTQ